LVYILYHDFCGFLLVVGKCQHIIQWCLGCRKAIWPVRSFDVTFSKSLLLGSSWTWRAELKLKDLMGGKRLAVLLRCSLLHCSLVMIRLKLNCMTSTRSDYLIFIYSFVLLFGCLFGYSFVYLNCLVLAFFCIGVLLMSYCICVV